MSPTEHRIRTQIRQHWEGVRILSKSDINRLERDLERYYDAEEKRLRAEKAEDEQAFEVTFQKLVQAKKERMSAWWHSGETTRRN